MTRRLSPLPRIRRDPASLQRAIRMKRERRQNTTREQRELEIATAIRIRAEVKQHGVAS